MNSSIRNANESGLRSDSPRSVPRLVKVRKHLASARGRSRAGSASQTQVRSDFNPFRQSGGAVHVDDRARFQELYDRYNSSGSSEESSEVGKPSDDSSNFVFGAKLTTSVEDEMTNLNISEASEGNDFVFGGSSGTAASRLQDEMKKLNIESFRNVKPDGVNDTANTDTRLQDELKNLNIKDTIHKVGKANDSNSEIKGSSGKGSFVFGNSRNDPTSLGVDGCLDSKLHDRLQNLDLRDTANVDNLKDSDYKPMESEKRSFMFGNSRNSHSSLGVHSASDLKLQEGLENLNIKDTDNGNVGRKNDTKYETKGRRDSFVFGKSRSTEVSSMQNELANEINKLNIDNSKVFAKVEESNEDSSKVSSRNISVFGDNKKEVDPFTRTAVNMLHDEMNKLNMGSETGNPGSFATKLPKSFSVEPQVPSSKSFIDSGVSNSMQGTFPFQATTPARSLSVGSDHSVQLNDSKSSGASTSQSFYSAGINFQSSGVVSEEPPVDGVRGTAEFAFQAPNTVDASCTSTTSLFGGLNQKLESIPKKGAVKNTKSKKKRGNTRQPAAFHQWPGQYDISGQYNISRESGFQENEESPGCYSPMDISPYRETIADDRSSRDASVTSDDYFQADKDHVTANADSSVSVNAIDEDLITATESLGINGDEDKGEESMDDFHDNVHMGDTVSGVKSEVLRFNTELDAKGVASSAMVDMDTNLHSEAENKGNDGKMEFCFTSIPENASSSDFTFAASTSSQGQTSVTKRPYKKKNRVKIGQDSYNSTLNAKSQFPSQDTSFIPLPSYSPIPITEQNRIGDSSFSRFIGEKRVEVNEEPKVKQGSIPRASTSSVAHEACEKWRLRGNQAYASGDLSKAEDYYTRGLNCVPKDDTSEGCITALTLCYSNRAAARMSSGRMRAALEDCRKAAELNPNFRKVQVRAANCYLALGEIEDALQFFNNALPPGGDLCLDRKIVIEASNGLQKAQQAGEYLDRCSELLRQRTANGAESALQIIVEALLISPYSEKLLEMKAEALFMLRKYEETIQLCEQSLESADKNSSSVKPDDSESIKDWPARIWRWSLMAKSYFYMGKLEDTLSFLEKLEQAESSVKKYGSKTLESSSMLAVTVRELLRHKAAGNDAFQSGRHSEAVEHYTSALSCNLESRPFAAVCFCNRAAAFQALGQLTDAIADCSFAIALDGNYQKAISRRATLHEMIRDYSQAATDLQRLLSLLEKKTEEKPNQSGRLGRSTSSIIDLQQTNSRLFAVEEEARRGMSLDLYLILGVEPSSKPSDIKKAYRKAALRHHPDKAAQVLPRSDNGDDGVWMEIAEEVHKDADRLFKMIGEAYAVLSDPVKRSEYDEEIRCSKKGNECNTPRTPSDAYSSPSERSGNRRQWQEGRRSYANQYYRW